MNLMVNDRSRQMSPPAIAPVVASIGPRTDAPSLGLAFGDTVSEPVRRRIDYSFRVFCAVYGLSPVTAEHADGVLCYHRPAKRSNEVVLGSSYQERPLDQPLKAPLLADVEGADGIPFQAFPLFHGQNEHGPDWLGEAFEWLSCAHERAAAAPDAAGRVPYAATLPGSFALDPERPYASIAFANLNALLRRHLGDSWPAAPRPPAAAEQKVLIANIHDVDFLPLSAGQAWYRLAKNLGIAALLHRSPTTVVAILRRAIGDLIRRRRPLDGLSDMLVRERDAGIGSTCAIICDRLDRRDANYQLSDPAVHDLLRSLQADDVELAVHGSYRSLEQPGQLEREYQALAQLTDKTPLGGRQHWLRYNDATLFDALERCGALYDASVGLSARPGFRSGAAFPYPPYNLREERPFRHLQLPLVLMDVALDGHRRDPVGAKATAERIMANVRTFGWGGVSVLWHDTVLSGCQINPASADLYWQLPRNSDRWLGGGELTKLVWPRYSAAGLLPPLAAVSGPTS